MAPVSLCLTLKKKSSLPITLENPATLTSKYSTVHLEKVSPRSPTFRLLCSYPRILAELRDDSHIVPRSSSVVVKRMPPARPGKGKAAMYIGASGSATPEAKPNSQAGSSSWTGRGTMSRRFDKDAPSKPTAVRSIRLFPFSLIPFLTYSAFDVTQSAPPTSISGKEDEVAAMAAMFQAQTANWEETQEKMSQLVSPLALLPVSCSNFSNTHFRCLFYRRPFCAFPSPLSVRPGFTPIHVERVRAVAEASRLPRTTNRLIGRSRLVMCATVVGRKVCRVLAPFVAEGVSDLPCVCEAIGFKIVQRIVIVSSTISHA
jgi:hypothetical protein